MPRARFISKARSSISKRSHGRKFQVRQSERQQDLRLRRVVLGITHASIAADFTQAWQDAMPVLSERAYDMDHSHTHSTSRRELQMARSMCWHCQSEVAGEYFCERCVKVQPVSKETDYFTCLGLSAPAYDRSAQAGSQILRTQPRLSSGLLSEQERDRTGHQSRQCGNCSTPPIARFEIRSNERNICSIWRPEP